MEIKSIDGKRTEVRPTDPEAWLTTWTPDSGEPYSAVKVAWLPCGAENKYREITAREHEGLAESVMNY
jgi:hypothetical protein